MVTIGTGRMTEHLCHAVGCNRPIPPSSHMCATHWKMVPRLIQRLIWIHYRKGQEIDKRPSVNYIATAFVSLSCVAFLEGKSLPALQSGMRPPAEMRETLTEGSGKTLIKDGENP